MTDQHTKLVSFYDSFIEKTDLGHQEARTRRNYVNNMQWTHEEEAKIKKRKQPVITDNAIKRKTDYFLGIERQTRTDPKAYPRTPEHDEAGEAFTDGIRYVCDNNEWDIERSEGFDNLIVEGIEGYSVTVEKVPSKDKDFETEITINHIQWDRIIYDPHSVDRFFRDAKYKGIVIWMDAEDVKDLFPGKEAIIEQSFTASDEDTVFDDKPNKAIWADKDRNRLKVIQLYHKVKGVWKHSIYTKSGMLMDTSDSEYQDEYGRPDCPIELAGAYIDKDNDRFGLVQDMISLSDMNNKLLSKLTHILNSNQTWGNQQGPDAKEAKKAAVDPNGHFTIKGDGKFGEDFGIIPTDNKAQHATNILNYVQNSLSQIGGNSLVDEGASGRSKEVTQKSKALELGPVLDTHRQCSKRVYRQVWNRIKQYKTEGWWVRVTDDEAKLKYVMINQPVTFRMALEEKFGQVPPEAEGHPGLDDPILDENGQPQVNNNVAEIDVDIIIEDAPDVINMQQEQFQILAKLAESYGPQEVPFEELVKLSSLRGKEAFIERTKGNEEQRAQNSQIQQQEQQEVQEIQKAGMVAEVEETQSKTSLNQAKTEETKVKAIETMAGTERHDLEPVQQQI